MSFFSGFFKTFTLTLLSMMTLSCAGRSHSVEYFKDGTFRNQRNHESKSLWTYLWMRLNTTAADWPESVPLEGEPAKPGKSSKELKIYYVNHSTFLIQKDNVNILTDPVFSERVSPLSWAGPKRVIPPGIAFENLPKIDVVLISHDHYDHLDIQSLKKLYQRDQPEMLVGLGVGRVFESEKYRELGWGEEFISSDIRYIFTPAQHFSGRSLFDKNTTLWGSFVIEFKDLRIYFAGDTGYSPHFKEIKNTYGSMDISLIPIGAYDPRSFMAYHHVDPEEAFQAYLDLESKTALGMHWGTFQLTNEARTEPRERLQAVAKKNNDTGFLVPENGQCFVLEDKSLKMCK